MNKLSMTEFKLLNVLCLPIDKTIKDNKPTDNELITIENVQLVKAIFHLSNMILNLFL